MVSQLNRSWPSVGALLAKLFRNLFSYLSLSFCFFVCKSSPFCKRAGKIARAIVGHWSPVHTGLWRKYWETSNEVVCCQNTNPVLQQKKVSSLAKGGYVYSDLLNNLRLSISFCRKSQNYLIAFIETFLNQMDNALNSCL